MTQEMMRVKLVPAQTVKLQVESFRGPRGLSGESPQGVVRRYGSLAQMQRDDTLAEGMTCLMDGDGETGVYRIRQATPLETKTDGKAIVLLKSGLAAERIDPWLRPGRTALPFSVSEGVQGELLECALSYYRQNARLIYGNGYTANNMAAGREPQNSPDTDEDGNPLFQLDCSAFIELVYSGVPYEASRYNPENAQNEKRYDWGFDFAGKEDYYHTREEGGTQKRMLANDLALYCRDRGWLLEPEEGLKNCQTGDILFFADTRYQDENYYAQIHHVAIFLWNNGYGNTVAMHCQTSDKEHPVTVNCMATSYRNTVVAVARLPLTRSRAASPKNLLINAEEIAGTRYRGEKRFFLCTGEMREALKPCTFYTAAVKIAQDENQQSQHITFRPMDVTTAIDRITRPAIRSADDTYEAHFFVNDRMEIVNSPSGRIPLGDTPCKGLTIAAYVYDEDGAYVEGGCVQTDTTIEWMELFEGVYHPDHSAGVPSGERRDKLSSTGAFVDLTQEIAPLDALHESARKDEIYFATVRTQDAQQAIFGLAIDRNYLLIGWRQSDAFGKQIVFNYAGEEILARNLYLGKWSEFAPMARTRKEGDAMRDENNAAHDALAANIAAAREELSADIAALGGALEARGAMLAGAIDRSATEITSDALKVGDYALYGCTALVSASFPEAASVGNYAFNQCKAMETVHLPKATKIGNYALRQCYMLTKIDLPKVTSIGSYAFESGVRLTAVILRSGTLCALTATNAFNSCYHILGSVSATYNPDGLADGYIYVPKVLDDGTDGVAAYEAAANWSRFAGQFRAIEDWPEVCGEG